MCNFIELCLQGKALLGEIDDYVDSWHEEGGEEPLHRFLGMTRSEYSLWVADPDVLPHIVNAHHSGKDVSELLDDMDALPLAARSDGPDKAIKLMRWLISEGMWE
jgi:hypothetical protein